MSKTTETSNDDVFWIGDRVQYKGHRPRPVTGKVVEHGPYHGYYVVQWDGAKEPTLGAYHISVLERATA